MKGHQSWTEMPTSTCYCYEINLYTPNVRWRMETKLRSFSLTHQVYTEWSRIGESLFRLVPRYLRPQHLWLSDKGRYFFLLSVAAALELSSRTEDLPCQVPDLSLASHKTCVSRTSRSTDYYYCDVYTHDTNRSMGQARRSARTSACQESQTEFLALAVMLC